MSSGKAFIAAAVSTTPIGLRLVGVILGDNLFAAAGAVALNHFLVNEIKDAAERAELAHTAAPEGIGWTGGNTLHHHRIVVPDLHYPDIAIRVLTALAINLTDPQLNLAAHWSQRWRGFFHHFEIRTHNSLVCLARRLSMAIITRLTMTIARAQRIRPTNRRLISTPTSKAPAPTSKRAASSINLRLRVLNYALHAAAVPDPQAVGYWADGWPSWLNGFRSWRSCLRAHGHWRKTQAGRPRRSKHRRWRQKPSP